LDPLETAHRLRGNISGNIVQISLERCSLGLPPIIDFAHRSCGHKRDRSHSCYALDNQNCGNSGGYSMP
jgi:hypothetical protein